MGVHVQRQSYNIHITCALAVTEQSTLNAVSAGEETQFSISDSAAAVVVGVEGNLKGIPVMQYLAHVFHLLCVNMRQALLNSNGEVDYSFPVGSRLPDVDDRVADLRSEFRLSSGEALRRVLEAEVTGSILAVFIQKFSAGNGDVDDLLLALTEYLLALSHGGGIIQVHDSILAALERLESFLDDVLTALGEHLYRNVVRYQILLDKRAAELVFCFGSSRKTYLDLLEADLDELLEELQLLIQAHWYYQRLITVTEVNAAPLGSLLYVVLFSPVHASERRHEISSCVLVCLCHILFLSGQRPA